MTLSPSGLLAAAAALNDYLVHSERIVLAVYARHMSDSGWDDRNLKRPLSGPRPDRARHPKGAAERSGSTTSR